MKSNGIDALFPKVVPAAPAHPSDQLLPWHEGLKTGVLSKLRQ